MNTATMDVASRGEWFLNDVPEKFQNVAICWLEIIFMYQLCEDIYRLANLTAPGKDFYKVLNECIQSSYNNPHSENESENNVATKGKRVYDI